MPEKGLEDLDHLPAVFPKDQEHSHQRTSGNDARGDWINVLLSMAWPPLLPKPGDGPAEKKQHRIVPLKDPRQPETSRRWKILLVTRKNHWQHGEDDPDRPADGNRPDLDWFQGGDAMSQGPGDGCPGLRRRRGELGSAENR